MTGIVMLSCNIFSCNRFPVTLRCAPQGVSCGPYQSEVVCRPCRRAVPPFSPPITLEGQAPQIHSNQNRTLVRLVKSQPRNHKSHLPYSDDNVDMLDLWEISGAAGCCRVAGVLPGCCRGAAGVLPGVTGLPGTCPSGAEWSGVERSEADEAE